MDTEGILIRAASEKSDTILFDAHPETNEGESRFLDSFVNRGEKIKLESPMDLKFTVMFKSRWGITVQIQRPLVYEAAKLERTKTAKALKEKHKNKMKELLKKAEEAEEKKIKANPKAKRRPRNSKGKLVIEQSEE